MWWYMYIFTYSHHKSIKTIANVRIETSLISLFYYIADRHDIAEILLKVALSKINQTINQQPRIDCTCSCKPNYHNITTTTVPLLLYITSAMHQVISYYYFTVSVVVDQFNLQTMNNSWWINVHKSNLNHTCILFIPFDINVSIGIQ
jgi:hypothetical protein